VKTWQNYFEWNRANRPSISWERGITIEPRLREPLIRSLQKFQLGESGDGHRLRGHARRTGDAAYMAAIDLFVKEEQEHARLMGEVLRLFGAPLLESDWTNRCFILLRRLFGLRQELMILLLPELIAKRFFRALHDGTDDAVLRAVFSQIAQDEEGHVAFHVDYLRRAFESMSFTQRILALVIWRILFRGTCAVVMLDHRAVLRAAGVSPSNFWREVGRIFDEAAAGIFTPAHLLAPFGPAANSNL
jgi:hypothetical protein